MFYIRDTYATVWNIRDIREKFSSISISTSEKDSNNNRKYSNWFATFIGQAHQKAKRLQQKDRIKILSGKINRIPRQKEDGTWNAFVNVVIFDFEMAEEYQAQDEIGVEEDGEESLEGTNSEDFPF